MPDWSFLMKTIGQQLILWYSKYMSEKVTGYLLLLAGIVIIALSSLSVYYVFKGRVKPIELFKLPGISIDLSNIAGADLPKESSDIGSQATLKTDLVEPDIINAPLNLFAHVIFMGFLVNVGFKVSSLGVQMLRPIKVNVKASEETKSKIWG